MRLYKRFTKYLYYKFNCDFDPDDENENNDTCECAHCIGWRNMVAQAIDDIDNRNKITHHNDGVYR